MHRLHSLANTEGVVGGRRAGCTMAGFGVPSVRWRSLLALLWLLYDAKLLLVRGDSQNLEFLLGPYLRQETGHLAIVRFPSSLSGVEQGFLDVPEAIRSATLVRQTPRWHRICLVHGQ